MARPGLTGKAALAAATFTTLLLLLAVPAHAGTSVTISPPTVRIVPGTSSTSSTVYNTGSTSYVVKSATVPWLLLSPASFSLLPAGEQVVVVSIVPGKRPRDGTAGAAAFVVRGPKASSGGIRISGGVSLRVNVGPPPATASSSMALPLVAGVGLLGAAGLFLAVRRVRRPRVGATYGFERGRP